MSQTVYGIYTDPERMEMVETMEHWLDRHHAVQTVFTPWDRGAIDGLFGRILPKIWDAGRVPLVTWEPYTKTPDATESDIAERIATGEYDAYLNEWATRLVEWLSGSDGEFSTSDDRRLYLRLAHEMNGDWYPWSPAVGGRPADYITMWRHVHDHLTRNGIGPDHLQWVWCVNHADTGARAEGCYPGDDYVDWVGVDGFNWGHSRNWSAWRSPREIFGGMFDRLERLTDRPLCVPEVACSSVTAAGHDPEKKAAWIREACAYLDSRVKLRCWFNEDKETDWAVFGGERGTHHIDGNEAYAAYRDAMAGTETEPPKRRLVSDAVFRGN